MIVVSNSSLDLRTLVKQATKFKNVDERRAKRAAQIIQGGGVKYNPLTQTWFVYSQSRQIIYKVRPYTCDCEDCQKGHVCKHRIAAWMTTQK